MLGIAKKVLTDAAADPEKAIDTANAVVDFLSRLATPDQQSRSFLVEEIKHSKKLTPLEKAAAISEHKKLLREYKNKFSIVEKALEMLGPQALEQSAALEPEWASRYLDSSKHVSKEETQLLWSKILAEECKRPGSIPKALIHTLSLLEKDTAEAFQKLCAFVVTPPGHSISFPIIDMNEQSQFLKAHGVIHAELEELARVGLITFNSAVTYELTNIEHIVLNYGDNIYLYQTEKNAEIQGSDRSPESLPLGNVSFSSLGRALHSVITPETVPDFYAYLSSYAKTKNCCVTNTQRVRIESEEQQ